MSVQTFEPTAARAGVRMTPSAVGHVRRQLDRAGAHAVRVSVNRSGCSGYMYQIDYVTEPRTEDREFKVAENLSVFVDTEALPLMQGTEIDLVVEGLNSTLKFRNPNAQMECGCGESFGV